MEDNPSIEESPSIEKASGSSDDPSREISCTLCTMPVVLPPWLMRFFVEEDDDVGLNNNCFNLWNRPTGFTSLLLLWWLLDRLRDPVESMVEACELVSVSFRGTDRFSVIFFSFRGGTGRFSVIFFIVNGSFENFET